MFQTTNQPEYAGQLQLVQLVHVLIPGLYNGITAESSLQSTIAERETTHNVGPPNNNSNGNSNSSSNSSSNNSSSNNNNNNKKHKHKHKNNNHNHNHQQQLEQEATINKKRMKGNRTICCHVSNTM